MLHQQNECILDYSRSNSVMSNTELQTFIDEVGGLSFDEKLRVLAAVLDSIRSSRKPEMSDARVNELYGRFTGCIKSAAVMDCRKEKLDYLDERYGLD